MSTITTTTVLALSDSIARHIIDTFAYATVSILPLLNGQTTTLARIAGLNDASQIAVLIDGFEYAMGQETSYMTSRQSYTAVIDRYGPACLSLERVTGGLAAYLVANSLQVVTQFSDAFNRYQQLFNNGAGQIASAQSGATRTPQYSGTVVTLSTATGAHLPTMQ